MSTSPQLEAPAARRHHADHEHEIDLESALDFLNTLDLDDGVLIEHLQQPGDAAAWFDEHGLIHDPDRRPWRDRDLDRTKNVRDALRAVVDAVVEHRPAPAPAIRTVNEALAAPRSLRLELDGEHVVVGHTHDGSPADQALVPIVDAIVGEIASGRPDRFRICANDRCRWTFFDASPTGRRRWCDMKTCGNRAKAARHRAKLRAAEESTPPEATRAS